MSDAPIRVDDDRVVADGVYFGLAESEYHQALALSASGIKSLRVSPLDWWARSVLNPEYRDEDSEAKIIGRAYHKRIIEGREAFEARYAPSLDPADYPGALRTNEELLVALAERGRVLPKTTRKDEIIAALLRCDQEPPPIWQSLAQAHGARHTGKTLLSGDLVRRIEIASAMIEKHPDLGRAFSGGEPEVSIFWHDAETGVPCKARLDYLKPRAIVDLKSYENSYGLPIRKAIARQVANYRYHIQAAWYLEAARMARRLIADDRAFGQDGNRSDYRKLYITSALLDSPGFTFLFVFQQKGIAPIATGMVLGQGSVMDIARMECEQARYTWARNWQTYGSDPWMSVDAVGTFDDSEFPAYLAE